MTLCPWCREAFNPAARQFHTCTIAPRPRPDHIRVRYAADTRYMIIGFAWSLPGSIALDRPICHEMVVLARHVHRLTRAFLDGMLYPDPRVAWDVHHQTYTSGRCEVQGKTVNADLNRIGF